MPQDFWVYADLSGPFAGDSTHDPHSWRVTVGGPRRSRARAVVEKGGAGRRHGGADAHANEYRKVIYDKHKIFCVHRWDRQGPPPKPRERDDCGAERTAFLPAPDPYR